jgi:hypothetical protein
MGFEVLTAVIKEISIFWYIIALCPLRVKRRFREIYHLHP